ncbi:MAG: alpha/beta hydrolase [Ignavibacteria bacterium]|jgi:pimeloyl-ACP methyl ester carboxylesterase|nr:alpha/beta hydrolase [Ignavibacteria bacterium]MDH7528612.1 alpha/beta hydrolase [Ignavibacteria bacterium]
MKKMIFHSLAILMILIFSACSSGFLYTNLPPLEFSEINYGFDVKYSHTSPKLAYIDEGKGEVILLVHGLASNLGFWRYNAPELAKHFRVIAVDLPGYGKSDKGNYSYKMKFFANTLKQLLDELQIEKVNFIGHSMGGQIGIWFSILYPERVNKLVLASPAGIEKFNRGEGEWLKSVVTIRSVKSTNEEGVRRNLSNNFYNWRSELEWMVEERVRMAKAKDFDLFAQAVTRSVAGMIDEPTYDKLALIKSPTLIIYGENDGLIPNPYLHPGFPADVFKIGHQKIRNSILHEIKKCGHMIMMEKPDEFNKAVINFLKN